MRENNAWANKAPGWIDYAFHGNGSLEKRIINGRTGREGSTFQYLTEAVGGRTRTDEVNLQWLITAPNDDESRGRYYTASAESTGRIPKHSATVVGREPQKSSDTSHTWNLRSPNAKTVELILSVPRDETEMQFAKGSKGRIYEIGIYTTTESDGGTMGTPYGKLSWLPSTKST